MLTVINQIIGNSLLGKYDFSPRIESMVIMRHIPINPLRMTLSQRAQLYPMARAVETKMSAANFHKVNGSSS